MPSTTTKPTRARRRRAQSARARTSKRRGGFDFGLRLGPFVQDPFFANTRPRLTPFVSIPRCDPTDPSCTSSSHSSSYSYTKSEGKAPNITHKEFFERKGKNAQGNTTVELKNVDYATKDGKTLKDKFLHYKIGEDTQGKYVDVFSPTGSVVDKEYVEGKKDKVSRIAAVIKKHPQKIGPHLRKGSVASPASQSDDECTSIADMVQKTLDAGETSPTKRASTLSRNRSRSRSVSSSSSSKPRARRSSNKTRRAH